MPGLLTGTWVTSSSEAAQPYKVTRSHRQERWVSRSSEGLSTSPRERRSSGSQSMAFSDARHYGDTREPCLPDGFQSGVSGTSCPGWTAQEWVWGCSSTVYFLTPVPKPAPSHKESSPSSGSHQIIFVYESRNEWYQLRAVALLRVGLQLLFYQVYFQDHKTSDQVCVQVAGAQVQPWAHIRHCPSPPAPEQPFQSSGWKAKCWL